MALDLSAAFNTVDHEILSSVLENNFGLEDTVLICFNSYLNNRSGKVNIRNEYSSRQNLPFSVPQGSCAGAQLFNLYCSSIQDILNQPLTLHGFADDHTVGNKFKPGDWGNEVRCMCELEKYATDLKARMNENRLKMNNNKTKFNSFWIKTTIG